MRKTVCLVLFAASISMFGQDTSSAGAANPAKEPQCRLSTADEKEVTAIPGRYRDAWFQADATAAVMKQFAEDATILPAHGTEPIHGKTSIITFWWPPVTRPFELQEFTMTPQRTAGCGRIAHVSGLQTLKWKYKDEEKSTHQAGTFLMVLRKQPDGHWLIESFMWDDKPYVTK